MAKALDDYLNGQDAAWSEENHHRADNGRFTAGSGRGKTGGTKDDKPKAKSKEEGETAGKDEVSQDVAEKAVRGAFDKIGGGLKSMKLVGHHLSVATDFKKEEVADKVAQLNGSLKKHGLKAKVDEEGGTTLHVAEDAGEEDVTAIKDDPMTGVLVGLCAVGMLSKDLHYRAKGKPFYGMHELSDIIWQIDRAFDDMNEVYFMGEKGVNPPERALVASAASKVVGTPGDDEDALIEALAKLLGELAAKVEQVKKTGVSGGTNAILDDISKKTLQAKGLLKRTQMSGANQAAIDKVIGKGISIG